MPSEEDSTKTSIAAIPEDKIECPTCTFLNDLTRESCDVCDSILFS